MFISTVFTSFTGQGSAHWKKTADYSKTSDVSSSSITHILDTVFDVFRTVTFHSCPFFICSLVFLTVIFLKPEESLAVCSLYPWVREDVFLPVLLAFTPSIFLFLTIYHYGVYYWDRRKRERAKGVEEKNKKERKGNSVDFLPVFSIPAWQGVEYSNKYLIIILSRVHISYT